MTAEATGFSSLERTATVEAGTTTTLNLQVQAGGISEKITVSNAAPLIRYDHHQRGGVVSRAQIENLPLNGRNFLDLARLEPGVTNPIKVSDNRVFVPVLGAGIFSAPRIGSTRVTVDGASIVISGSIGAELQVSQDAVQEFQISTVNFDLSTSMTTNGAINIVTRSGGNKVHGGGFYFYRDHNLSAYPGLQRDLSNPNPFFQRSQFGYQLGGPIRRDRFFFFTNYERNNQRGVLSIQPGAPEFAPLGGIFPTPYYGNQFNLRFDGRLNPNHNAFLRYTHDGNRAFGPPGAAVVHLCLRAGPASGTGSIRASWESPVYCHRASSTICASRISLTAEGTDPPLPTSVRIVSAWACRGSTSRMPGCIWEIRKGIPLSSAAIN